MLRNQDYLGISGKMAKYLRLWIHQFLKSFGPQEAKGTAQFCYMFDSFLTIQNTVEHKLKCKLFLKPFESVDDERLEWLTEVSRMDSNQLRTGLEIFPRMQDCSRYVGFNDNIKRMSCIVKPIQGNCRGGFWCQRWNLLWCKIGKAAIPQSKEK